MDHGIVLLPDVELPEEAKALAVQARLSEAEHSEFLSLQQKHFEELQQSMFWQGASQSVRRLNLFQDLQGAEEFASCLIDCHGHGLHYVDSFGWAHQKIP